MNDNRPAATERAPPVAAYTLLPLPGVDCVVVRLSPVFTNCRQFQSAFDIARINAMSLPDSSSCCSPAAANVCRQSSSNDTQEDEDFDTAMDDSDSVSTIGDCKYVL